MSQVVLCQYFIQNEDGVKRGKRDLYNAFVLPKKVNSLKEVRVGDIKGCFPFDPSEYHFRFQTKMANMKVWVDTSKDTVAVPNIDGIVKIKLLKFPKGVRGKKPVIPSHVGERVQDFGQAKAPFEPAHQDNLSPSKGKPIHHSNSQNNLADKNIDLEEKNGHKPKSQMDHGDLIGGFEDEEDKVPDNEMNFNIDTDDLFGSKPDSKPNQKPTNYDHGDLLGDFDTTHDTGNSNPTQEPPSNFDLAGGLDDLGGLDFNANPNKGEDKKDDGPISLSDHVSNIHKAGAKERDEWQLAYQKYDQKIKFWKGEPVMNSIKVLI